MFFRKTQMPMGTENWSNVKFGEKQKLFKIHNFLFMCGGKTFNIEVQEGIEGGFLAHADNTSDPHDAIKSFQGKNLEESLQAMVKFIETREKA